MEFSIAMNCLSLFRSITDSLKDLPLSAINMILSEKDMVCQLVLILEASPWIRKRKSGMERFESGTWQRIEDDDFQVVGKIEAQVMQQITQGLACTDESAFGTRIAESL
jgi:hypothetical protein